MNLYLLFKSLHLISVISWMAGLLYLPRIFVYHAEADHDSQKLVFKTMERKLYNFIMMPAMLLSWIFGILLLHSLGFKYSPVIPNNLVAPDGMVFWPSNPLPKSLPLKGLRKKWFACLFSRQV